MSAERPPGTTARRPVRNPPPGPAARRFGYVVAAAVNALLLFLVNVRPGWDAVPFLTDDTPLVLGAVSASMLAGLVANLLYLVADPHRLRALGDAVTTGVGLYALVRIWQVFPVDVTDGWSTALRVLLAVGIAGSAIAVVVALVRLATGRRGAGPAGRGQVAPPAAEDAPPGAGSAVSDSRTRQRPTPPAWFVHGFWRAHRRLYRLSGGRFLVVLEPRETTPEASSPQP